MHEVPNGAHVGPDGVVTRRDGSTFQLHYCTPHGRAGGKPGFGFSAPVNNGWIEWADYYASGTFFSKLTASWNVPASPAGYSAGTYVYNTFPGIENGRYILQPVIAFNGAYWNGSSWHCDDGTNCIVSSYISLASGDLIQGSVTSSNCAGGYCTWTVITTDARTGQAATLSITDTNDYYYAVGGAVEVYGISTCSQYPYNGVSYSNLALYDTNGQQVTPSWREEITGSLSPSCNFGVRFTPTTVDLCHVPSMTLNAAATSPSPAVQYTPFSLTLTGCGFDPSTVQVEISGPNTQSCPCSVISDISPFTVKTTTQLTLSPVTLGQVGTFYVYVRNGTSGSWTGGRPFTVRSRY